MTSFSTTATRSLALGRVWAVIAGTVTALVLNLILWLVGLAAGGEFEVSDGATTMVVAPGGVVTLTVVPVVVGLGLTALISLRWLGVIRVAQVVGVIAPLATIAMTVAADFDVASTVTLSLMHVVIAGVVPVALEAMRAGVLRSSTKS